MFAGFAHIVILCTKKPSKVIVRTVRMLEGSWFLPCWFLILFFISVFYDPLKKNNKYVASNKNTHDQQSSRMSRMSARAAHRPGRRRRTRHTNCIKAPGTPPFCPAIAPPSHIYYYYRVFLDHSCVLPHNYRKILEMLLNLIKVALNNGGRGVHGATGWHLAVKAVAVYYLAQGGGAYEWQPPLTGWQVGSAGSAPAPTLVAGPST